MRTTCSLWLLIFAEKNRIMGDTSTIYCALQSGDEYFAKREYFLAACEYRVAAYVYTCGDPYGFMPDSDPIRKFFKCFKKLKPNEQRKFWPFSDHENFLVDYHSNIRELYKIEEEYLNEHKGNDVGTRT